MDESNLGGGGASILLSDLSRRRFLSTEEVSANLSSAILFIRLLSSIRVSLINLLRKQKLSNIFEYKNYVSILLSNRKGSNVKLDLKT